MQISLFSFSNIRQFRLFIELYTSLERLSISAKYGIFGGAENRKFKSNRTCGFGSVYPKILLMRSALRN